MLAGREVVGVDYQNGNACNLSASNVAGTVVYAQRKAMSYRSGGLVVFVEFVYKGVVGAVEEGLACEGGIGIDANLVAGFGQDIGKSIATGHAGVHVLRKAGGAVEPQQIAPLVGREGEIGVGGPNGVAVAAVYFVQAPVLEIAVVLGLVCVAVNLHAEFDAGIVGAPAESVPYGLVVGVFANHVVGVLAKGPGVVVIGVWTGGVHEVGGGDVYVFGGTDSKYAGIGEWGVGSVGGVDDDVGFGKSHHVVAIELDGLIGVEGVAGALGGNDGDADIISAYGQIDVEVFGGADVHSAAAVEGGGRMHARHQCGAGGAGLPGRSTIGGGVNVEVARKADVVVGTLYGDALNRYAVSLERKAQLAADVFESEHGGILILVEHAQTVGACVFGIHGRSHHAVFGIALHHRDIQYHGAVALQFDIRGRIHGSEKCASHLVLVGGLVGAVECGHIVGDAANGVFRCPAIAICEHHAVGWVPCHAQPGAIVVDVVEVGFVSLVDNGFERYERLVAIVFFLATGSCNAHHGECCSKDSISFFHHLSECRFLRWFTA